MGMSIMAIANIVSTVAAMGSAAHSAKAQRKRGKEETHLKHKTEAKTAKAKEKERLARLKGESPGQRLLGGRPSLG